jgi:hypothetical protein
MTLHYSSLQNSVYIGGRYAYESNWYLCIFDIDSTTGEMYVTLQAELSGYFTNLQIQTMSEDSSLIGGCVGMYTSSSIAYIGTVVY